MKTRIRSHLEHSSLQPRAQTRGNVFVTHQKKLAIQENDSINEMSKYDPTPPELESTRNPFKSSLPSQMKSMPQNDYINFKHYFRESPFKNEKIISNVDVLAQQSKERIKECK